MWPYSSLRRATSPSWFNSIWTIRLRLLDRLEFRAIPGLNSTRQNPLLGASKIYLALDGHQLRLDAELGGVDSMRRFLMRFPFLLGLGLGLFFGIGGGFMFGRQFGVGFGVPWAQGWTWMFFSIGVAMLPVAPWLFLSPMMSNMIRTRTQNALYAIEVLFFRFASRRRLTGKNRPQVSIGKAPCSCPRGLLVGRDMRLPDCRSVSGL